MKSGFALFIDKPTNIVYNNLRRTPDTGCRVKKHGVPALRRGFFARNALYCQRKELSRTVDQQKIGAFLKDLRKEKGLTQEQLAERFHVSDRTVSRWENGNNMPDLSVLVELAEFYEVEIREIIDGERKSGEMNTETNQTVQVVADYAKEEKKHIKRRTKIISVVVTLAAVTALIPAGLFLNVLFGNPVSKYLAMRNAQDYLDWNYRAEQYAGSGYRVSGAEYWIEDQQYIVHAEIEGSRDTALELRFGMHGNFLRDNADRVLEQKGKVLDRMTNEYYSLVLDAFQGTKYENADMLFGQIVPADEGDNTVPGVDPDGIGFDRQIDYAEIGKTAGALSITLTDETKTPENLASNLLEIRAVADGAQLSFAAVNLILAESAGEGAGFRSLAVFNFPYDEIYEDGLLERVTAAAIEE